MRVKKDGSTNKDGNKSLSLNIPNDGLQSNTNTEDLDTPLLLDQNDFPDLVDMIPYNGMPYYPTAIFPYGDYTQAGYPVDQEGYEAMMNSFFLDGSNEVVDDDDDDTIQESAGERPVQNTNEPVVQSIGKLSGAVVPPNLENYSLKVKVRHPERKAKDKLSAPSEASNRTDNVQIQNSTDIPNTSGLSTVNFPTAVKNPPEVSNSDTVVKDAMATAVPKGTIVLPDGYILIPTNNNQTNILHTENLPQVLTTNLANVSNNIDSLLPAQTSIMNSLIPTIVSNDLSTTVDPTEVVIQTKVSPTAGSFEPASPTATPNSTVSRRKYSPKTSTVSKPKVTARTDNLALPAPHATNIEGKTSRNFKTQHITKHKLEQRHPEYFEEQKLKIPKLTPVSTITDIVSAAKKHEIEENIILKEAVSKPIKHRTNIMDIETVQERSVKNAINARVNRQKHKVYVQTLEDENNELKNRVSELEAANNILQQEKELLNSEVVYLKCVIANESSLSNVLSGMNGLKNIELTSSFAKKFQKRSDVNMPQTTGGVCVHVTGQQASLEFCDKCARMAIQGKAVYKDETLDLRK